MKSLSSLENYRKVHGGRMEHVYVTKRWRVIAWFLKAIPDRLYHKL